MAIKITTTIFQKVEDLEEKLKQSKFKEYLAQSAYPSQSQYENRVERPYSMNKNYTDSFATEYSIPESPKPMHCQMASTLNKTVKSPALQIMYSDTKSPNMPRNDKKGHFNITKKRKLYSEKDFLNQQNQTNVKLSLIERLMLPFKINCTF